MTPGRIAALAIGVPIALTLIGWTGFALFGSLLGEASFPVSLTVPVSDGRVDAHIEGNVTLSRGDVQTAKLTGTVHYSLFRPTVTPRQTATSTVLGFACHTFPFGDCSLDSTLVVPQATTVSLSTGGGDVSVGDFTGDVSLNTQGGNIFAGNLTAAKLLQLVSGGGDVTATTLNGPLRVTANGGNVNADAVIATTATIMSGGGDVTATSVQVPGGITIVAAGGNINVGAMAAPAATILSGGGDITLKFTQAPSNVQIRANGGNVTLLLPGGAHYDIQANPSGGNVTNTVPEDTHALNKIVVNSGGGDITISEAS